MINSGNRGALCVDPRRVVSAGAEECSRWKCERLAQVDRRWKTPG
jgi:hypothetical protein